MCGLAFLWPECNDYVHLCVVSGERYRFKEPTQQFLLLHLVTHRNWPAGCGFRTGAGCRRDVATCRLPCPPARVGTRSLPFLRPVKKQSRDPLGKRKYSRAISGGNTPFTRFKTFLFCKSFPPEPFLFLLRDSLHGFPRLFTFISEHICFMLFSFSVFTLYSCRFRAVD